jgi:uncharacterized protein (DUF2236 family)
MILRSQTRAITTTRTVPRLDEAEFAELAGYYGPDSVTWRVGSEAALMVGGARAILMQLAHPLVAAGVGQHSSYGSDPWGRMYRTLDLGRRMTFGTRGEARAAARTINRLHTHVTGELAVTAGSLAGGTPYRAREPELLLWVFATLVDTALSLYPLLVGPLSANEQEQYYQEGVEGMRLLGMAVEAAPPSLAAFKGYMRDMLAGDALALTPPAADVARTILNMPAPLPLRPLLRPALFMNEQLTIGLLPPRLRDLYGFRWSHGQQALFDLWAASMRLMVPRLPAMVRQPPWARAAWRRMRRGY